MCAEVFLFAEVFLDQNSDQNYNEMLGTRRTERILKMLIDVQFEHI